MAYKSYGEKLQNPQWQKKRLEILNRDQFTCQLCGDKGSTLHVHHKKYIKGRDPWDYKDDNFKTLCKYCHLIVEFFKKTNDIVLICQKVMVNENTSFQRVFIKRKLLGFVCFDITIEMENLVVDRCVYQIEAEEMVRVFKTIENPSNA